MRHTTGLTDIPRDGTEQYLKFRLFRYEDDAFSELLKFFKNNSPRVGMTVRFGYMRSDGTYIYEELTSYRDLNFFVVDTIDVCNRFIRDVSSGNDDETEPVVWVLDIASLEKDFMSGWEDYVPDERASMEPNFMSDDTIQLNG